MLLEIHGRWAWFVIVGNGLAGVWALGANWLRVAARPGPVVVHGRRRGGDLRPGGLGVGMVAGQKLKAPQFHMFYGFVAIISVGDHLLATAAQLRDSTATCSTASAACS